MPDQDLINRFTTDYYHDRQHTWCDTRWQGRYTYKAPTDLWIYQEIIYATRPDLIIECGTCEGGTTLFMAHMLDLINNGQVVSIDINDRPNLPGHKRIEYIQGKSSVDPGVVTYLTSKALGGKVMVVLDSDHSKSHVLAELEAYGPLVSPGCYLICEDTSVHTTTEMGFPGPGPHEALVEFLTNHPEFHSDKYCERFMLTFNLDGYLLKS